MRQAAPEEEIDERLPMSLESERTIIGAVLLDNEVFFDEIGDLSADDFYLGSHRAIFKVINDILFGLVEGCKHVDLVTLCEELGRRKMLSSVGGASYISSLLEGLPRHLAVDDYVSAVRDKAKLRRLVSLFSTAVRRAEDQSETAARIAADVQDQLVDEAAEGEGKAVRIGEVAPAVVKQLNESRKISDERSSVELTWGISGLDAFTKGAFGGEVTVLAADSGGGKTAFGVQMTLANAVEDNPSLWFSLEMQKEKLSRRYYPSMSKIITADHMRDPRLINEHTHIPEIERLSLELSKMPIWIDDTSPLDIKRMVPRIRMMRRKHGIRLVVIDYLQLISNKAAQHKAEQVEGNIFALRELAKVEPTVHILVLSQYSKTQNFMKKKRRTKDDLQWGSAIHQAAQNVILITIEDPEKKDKNDLLDVEFRIDKQRDGRVGKVTCMYDRDHLTYVYPQPLLT